MQTDLSSWNFTYEFSLFFDFLKSCQEVQSNHKQHACSLYGLVAVLQ